MSKMKDAYDKIKKKYPLGQGGRFKSIEKKVEGEGYSKESAKAIAAKAGMKAHGKAQMSKLAAKGKNRKT